MTSEKCGFSCSYALAKIQKVLDELELYSKENPEYALKISGDIVEMAVGLDNKLYLKIQDSIIANA